MRQKSFEAAKLVMKEVKKKKRKEKALKANNKAVVSCYGCGAPLQTLDNDAPGYVDPDTYDLVIFVGFFILFYDKFLWLLIQWCFFFFFLEVEGEEVLSLVVGSAMMFDLSLITSLILLAMTVVNYVNPFQMW